MKIIGDIKILPHGIDILESEKETLLYVISHAEKHRLEVFNVYFNTKSLVYRDDLSRVLPKNANDISLINIDHWFISFNHHGKTRFLRMLKDFLRQPLSYVGLVTPYTLDVVADGFNFSDGVYYNPRKNYYISLL